MKFPARCLEYKTKSKVLYSVNGATLRGDEHQATASKGCHAASSKHDSEDAGNFHCAKKRHSVPWSTGETESGATLNLLHATKLTYVEHGVLSFELKGNVVPYTKMRAIGAGRWSPDSRERNVIRVSRS